MDYNTLVENLEKIIMPVLEQEYIGLVELKLVKASQGLILKLLVDKKEGGISLEECAYLNQKIGSLLDNQNIMTSRYFLEVSSPGLGRPLKTKNDFLRCINREVKFFLNKSIEGRLELDGIIQKVDDEAVYIDTKDRILAIPISKIGKAKQIIQ